MDNFSVNSINRRQLKTNIILSLETDIMRSGGIDIKYSNCQGFSLHFVGLYKRLVQNIRLNKSITTFT